MYLVLTFKTKNIGTGPKNKEGDLTVGENNKNTKWPGSNDDGQMALSAVKNKLTHS